MPALLLSVPRNRVVIDEIVRDDRDSPSDEGENREPADELLVAFVVGMYGMDKADGVQRPIDLWLKGR